MDIQGACSSITHMPLGFLSWHGRFIESVQGPNGELPKHASHKYDMIIAKLFDGRYNMYHLLREEDLEELVPRLRKRLFSDGKWVSPENGKALRNRPYWIRADCSHPLKQRHKIKNICFMAYVDTGKNYKATKCFNMLIDVRFC